MTRKAAKKRYTPKGAVGTGQRFKQLTAALKKRTGKSKVRNVKALAAWIGRKKYGKARFQKMAAAGRKKK